jgi:hypothetical protein
MIWVAIASGFVVGMPALWMLTRGLWPDSFARRLAVSQAGVGKSLLIGLLPVIMASLIMAVIGKRLGPVPGILVSGTLIVWGFMGSAGLASLIGERLWPAGQAWQQTRNGGLVLICCALVPVIGWFIILPLIAIIGMGVNVRSWFGDKASPAPVLAAQPPPMHANS